MGGNNYFNIWTSLLKSLTLLKNFYIFHQINSSFFLNYLLSGSIQSSFLRILSKNMSKSLTFSLIREILLYL